MNAPARFPRPIRVDESGHERAHRASIGIHCPNCDEMEMAARVDLATIRDQASAGMMKAGDSAAVVLGEVSRLATQAVYAPLPASRLIRLRGALVLAVEAARGLERAMRDG